ncbi:hypothetical protein KQH52_03060 [Mycetohabitans sp. B7]|nr:hypothetical protein [Mycetohabitans sp. B7]
MLSLPMDCDLHAALNNHQPAYICAQAVCPQPTALTLSPGVALANPLAKRPTTYQDLPHEVIARIGHYVPVQDVMSFSAVDRRTYHAMRMRRLVYSYWQRANQAVSLESIKQLLDEMGDTLADPAQHAEPLDALRRRLRALPKAGRVDVFKRLYAAAQRIPQDGVQIQKAMLLTHYDYDEHEWMELFDFAHSLAEQRGPRQDNVWLELTLGLWSFSIDTPETPQFAQRYHALLARLPSLHVAEQAQMIPLLSRFLKHFNKANPRIPELYSTLCERARRLPILYQGASVGVLADSVWLLPKVEQPVRYAQMRNWALSLPNESLGIALRYLLEGLYKLSSEQQAQEFALLERRLAHVPAGQRTHAAIGLLKCVSIIDDTQAKRVWRQGLNLLNGGSEAALWDVLSELRDDGVLFDLEDHQWEIAMDEITHFMEANLFSEPARARIQNSAPWLRSMYD